jgi:uncharacterized protein YqjF (DUF2071 family)
MNVRAMLATTAVPWPRPSQPWIMRQTWQRLLFAHWPVPAAALAARLPTGLTLDTFAGQAWLGVVPFFMRGVRPRGTPAVPWLSHFPELNVRTYVTAAGKPGVWFFSLDAGNPVAVQLARSFFHLPYFNAQFTTAQHGQQVDYASRRAHRGAPAAALDITYGPSGSIFHAAPGTLEYWLTERYCLYSADKQGLVYRGDIRHAPWPLQLATATIRVNTMAAAHGLALPTTLPLLHYAHRQEIVAWAIQRI